MDDPINQAAGTVVSKTSATMFGIDDVEGAISDLIESTVYHIKTGAPIGTMFFKRVKMPVIFRYRELRNGDVRRKGDEAKANDYLFRRAFDHFEFKVRGEGGNWTEPNGPCELDLGQHKSELEFWLSAGKLVDAQLIKYHQENFPDTDFRKSGTGGSDNSES